MHVEPITQPINILLVEDNLGDIRLTQEALKHTGFKNTLNVVTNGSDALAFLKRRGKFSSSARPDLILLDLNLPRLNGREVLSKIKSDPKLKRIPVVILTTSSAEDDILQAYNLHANCFVTKSVDLDQFFRVMQKIEEFWQTVAQLPPKEQ
ncbi:MAG: response regulator [Chloroflexi bacterium]|nr:MAG: response regulator [Chloroflexota bacterium]